LKVESQPSPAWIHRGCRIALMDQADHTRCYAIQHRSGLSLGTCTSLDHARQRIDQELPLLRQRLIAAA